MPQSELTPAAQRRLATTVLQLTDTQGFMYLPVLAQSQASAAAALAYLESAVQSRFYRVRWPMETEQAADFESKKTQGDSAEIAQAQMQLLREQRNDLLGSLDQAIAILPPSTVLVLDVCSSTRHALALSIVTYLNLRREPLRAAKLRLILCWPQVHKEALIAGAPDLWSMRTDSLWVEQDDLSSQALSLVENTPPITTLIATPIDPELKNLNLSPAQQRQLAQWQQFLDLDRANISMREGLNLLNELALSGRTAVFEALSEALEAKIPFQKTPQKDMYKWQLLQAVANQHHFTGDISAALNAGLKSFAIIEKLSQDNPAAYEPDLAMSLNNLASFYSNEGNHAAALSTAQRAVDIREKLAKANPAAYEPVLAGSLNNLASFYGEDGKHAAALSTAQRAVEIREKLTKANPAAHEPDLAMSLNTLATFYADVGNHAAALSSAQRAVEIREKLTKANPAAYEPDLARSLNNLANHYSNGSNHAAALSAAQRAVEIYARLHKVRPAAYERNFAIAKRVLADLEA